YRRLRQINQVEQQTALRAPSHLHGERERPRPFPWMHEGHPQETHEEPDDADVEHGARFIGLRLIGGIGERFAGAPNREAMDVKTQLLEHRDFTANKGMARLW